MSDSKPPEPEKTRIVAKCRNCLEPIPPTRYVDAYCDWRCEANYKCIP